MVCLQNTNNNNNTDTKHMYLGKIILCRTIISQGILNIYIMKWIC